MTGAISGSNSSAGSTSTRTNTGFSQVRCGFRDPVFADHAARSQQHGIRRGDVVILAVENHEDGERDYEGPAKNSIAPSFAAKEQPAQSRHPQRQREGVHHQDLLQNESHRIQLNVAAAGADVVHQLHEGPIAVHIPKQVRQENQECQCACDPDPSVGEGLALRRE